MQAYVNNVHKMCSVCAKPVCNMCATCVQHVCKMCATNEIRKLYLCNTYV